MGVSASNWTRVMEMDIFGSQRVEKRFQIKSNWVSCAIHSQITNQSDSPRRFGYGSLPYRKDEEKMGWPILEDVTYSQISLVSVMRTFQNTPNSIKDIQRVSESIEQAFLDLVVVRS